MKTITLKKPDTGQMSAVTLTHLSETLLIEDPYTGNIRRILDEATTHMTRQLKASRIYPTNEEDITVETMDWDICPYGLRLPMKASTEHDVLQDCYMVTGDARTLEQVHADLDSYAASERDTGKITTATEKDRTAKAPDSPTTLPDINGPVMLDDLEDVFKSDGIRLPRRIRETLFYLDGEDAYMQLGMWNRKRCDFSMACYAMKDHAKHTLTDRYPRNMELKMTYEAYYYAAGPQSTNAIVMVTVLHEDRIVDTLQYNILENPE